MSERVKIATEKLVVRHPMRWWAHILGTAVTLLVLVVGSVVVEGVIVTMDAGRGGLELTPFAAQLAVPVGVLVGVPTSAVLDRVLCRSPRTLRVHMAIYAIVAALIAGVVVFLTVLVSGIPLSANPVPISTIMAVSFAVPTGLATAVARYVVSRFPSISRDGQNA